MIQKNSQRFVIPALACVLYFAEGFPYGIATETVNIYLSFVKVDLTTIGLVSSVGLIWTSEVLLGAARRCRRARTGCGSSAR